MTVTSYHKYPLTSSAPHARCWIPKAYKIADKPLYKHLHPKSVKCAEVTRRLSHDVVYHSKDLKNKKSYSMFIQAAIRL
jgi:hypothetical protein